MDIYSRFAGYTLLKIYAKSIIVFETKLRKIHDELAKNNTIPLDFLFELNIWDRPMMETVRLLVQFDSEQIRVWRNFLQNHPCKYRINNVDDLGMTESQNELWSLLKGYKHGRYNFGYLAEILDYHLQGKDIVQEILLKYIPQYEHSLAFNQKSYKKIKKALEWAFAKEQQLRAGMSLDDLASSIPMGDFSFVHEKRFRRSLEGLYKALQDHPEANVYFHRSGLPFPEVLQRHPGVKDQGDILSWAITQFREISLQGWITYVKKNLISLGIGYDHCTPTMMNICFYDDENLTKYWLENSLFIPQNDDLEELHFLAHKKNWTKVIKLIEQIKA